MLKEIVRTFNQQVFHDTYEQNYSQRMHRVLRHMQYGSARRNLLLALAKESGQIWVNRKYCPQVKRDRDLQRLIKEGKLKLINGRPQKLIPT